MPQMIHAASLLFHAEGYHLVHATIDAVEERGAIHIKSHFDDAKRALFGCSRAQRGIGAAALGADFQGVYYSLGVFAVDHFVIFRVEDF